MQLFYTPGAEVLKYGCKRRLFYLQSGDRVLLSDFMFSFIQEILPD